MAPRAQLATVVLHCQHAPAECQANQLDTLRIDFEHRVEFFNPITVRHLQVLLHADGRA
jgi:hypothetical protein